MAVTVPGASGAAVTIATGSGDVLGLAQQISNILAGDTVGGLTVSVASSGSIPDGPGVGATSELILTGTGAATLPSGGSYTYVVTDWTPPGGALTGSNAIIVGGGSVGGAYDISGTSTLAGTGG
ncbi:MAG TPA: hypothetical protein VHU42_18050, partial [Rhodopila sp.]|nr:hypothetical protein [Rhodopila sp.]